MGAGGQPTQYILGPHHRQRIGLGGAVQGGADEGAARAHRAGGQGDEAGGIGHVLDHLHGQHHVEGAGRHVLGAAHPVVDGQTRLLGMHFGDADVLVAGIHAGHGKTHAGQRLAEQAAAAAHVQQRQPLERPHGLGVAAEMLGQLAAHEGQPDGIEFVQRLELAPRVPPGFGHGGESGDLVHRGRAFTLTDSGGGHALGRVRIRHRVLLMARAVSRGGRTCFQVGDRV